jgi:protein-tyrosine-phosphatase
LGTPVVPEVKARMQVSSAAVSTLSKRPLQRAMAERAQLQADLRDAARDPGAPEGRAMDFINRLDNYDGKEIAKIALRDEYGMFEEAFTIYKKFEHHLDAVGVLLTKCNDIERAFEYAQRVNKPEVWSTLAAAQLAAALIKDAIDSYIKAADPANFEAVIAASEAEGKFDDLVRFLEMARKSLKERAVDSALTYALAQTNRLADLEAFVTSPNVADIQHTGERTFDEGLFEASRVLFTAASNFPKLASTLVALGLFREAGDAAKKTRPYSAKVPAAVTRCPAASSTAPRLLCMLAVPAPQAPPAPSASTRARRPSRSRASG